MPMEFVRTYHAQAHEITDAVTAVVINAKAGLQLRRAQSPDLEVVRQVLDNIANDGERAGDIVVRRTKRPMPKPKKLPADIANTPLLEPVTQLAYVVRRRLERLTNAVRDE